MKKKYIVPDSFTVKLYTINGLLQERPIVGSKGQSHDEQLIKSRYEEYEDYFEERDWGYIDKSIW